MNRSGLNSSQVNGFASAGWLIAASAVVTAGVTSSATTWRVLGASAFGNAAAVVTLSTDLQIFGRAEGAGTVSQSAYATTIFAGSAETACGSYGNGAILRSVMASAAADASATGEAIAASKLGASTAVGSASSVQAKSNVVFPGAANTVCSGAGIANALVTRMCPAYGYGGVVGFGEASTRLSGESFYRLDGFSMSSATAVATLRNDYSATIATHGVFDFGLSSGTGSAFIQYQTSADALSTAVGSATADRTTNGIASSAAASWADVGFTAIIPASAAGSSIATAYVTRASALYYVGVSGQCDSTSFPVAALTQQSGQASGIATAKSDPFWAAEQHWSGASSDCVSAVYLAAPTMVYASNVSDASSSFGIALPANFHLAGASTDASATAMADAKIAIINRAEANAYASATAMADAKVAIFNRAEANAYASATAMAFGNVTLFGFAFGQGSVSVTAQAFTNASVFAPMSRSMTAPVEDRLMLVPVEYRVMIAEV